MDHTWEEVEDTYRGCNNTAYFCPFNRKDILAIIHSFVFEDVYSIRSIHNQVLFYQEYKEASCKAGDEDRDNKKRVCNRFFLFIYHQIVLVSHWRCIKSHISYSTFRIYQETDHFYWKTLFHSSFIAI